MASAFSAAQITTGSISGFLFDREMKRIPRAAVVASDAQHSLSRRTSADSAGFYRFVELPPAVYVVTASAPGFQEVSTAGVRVAVDSHLSVDLHLPVAGLRQSITVTTAVRSIPAESSDLGVVLDQWKVERLPLNRRDFLQLALLTAGVSPPVQDSELSTRGSFAMHASGGREEFNNYLLDGVDNNDQDTNRFVLQPSVDVIQEFKIAINKYSAEYGRSAGAQVNVITRSGTNEWRASAYEYLRNRVLDARNAYDGQDKPQYLRNQFGGGAGGPIAKDRAFCFASLDGLRERRGLSRLATVPNLDERQGDLSGPGETIIDPFTQAPFPGNRVPASRISPVARKVIELFPLPNRSGTAANYLAGPVSRDSQSQFNTRFDWYLTASSRLALRYSYGGKELFEPYAEEATDVPGFGDHLRDRAHNAMVHYEYVLGPSTVNSLLLGFNRGPRQLLPENYAVDANKLWGVNYLPTQPRDFGYPGVNAAGYSRVGDVTQLPIDRAETTYQLSEGLSLVRRSHALKLGAEFRRIRMNGCVRVLTRGTMTFSGILSGTGMSDLLLGMPSFALQSQADNPQALRTSAMGFYFQDDWKIRPNLTLNLGLRYDYDTPATDPGNHMSVFDLRTREMARVGTNGISRAGIRPDRNNFAPRVGFAWTPTADSVVRGGYGVYFDSGMLVVNSSLYFNPPFFTMRVFFPTRTSLLTLSNPFPTAGGFSPPASINTLSPDISSGSLQHWNLDLQREMRAIGTVSLAYAGSKGTHLIRVRDLNQPAPGPGDVGERAPIPGFSNFFFIESGANSNFHSLQATVNRPMAHGLSILAAYTLSKSIDDASAFLSTKADRNFPQNSSNYRAERGLSSFDIHQRATLAYVYLLPSGSRWLRNWETSAIVTLQTGQPFTPLLRFDNSNTGNTGGTFGSDRPNLTGNPKAPHPTAERWFNTAAFAVPPECTFGNAGRNIVRGPGYASFDVSIGRRFPIAERGAFQVQVQAFNLLNRVNYDLPERYADEPASFGRIFSAKAPRQVQLAVRYSF